MRRADRPDRAPSEPQTETRERLIASAGDEFARVGFSRANVRSICRAAEANVSAVKYHFGSKEDLYLAVWGVAVEQMISAEPMPTLALGKASGEDPCETLAAFIAWFMRLVLTESETHPWAGQLLAHESVSPTPGALDVFVEGCARPIKDEVSRIVREIIGPRVRGKRFEDLVFAVIALCVNAKHSREILTRFGHPPPDTRASINRMARNMADFAISGLIGIAEDNRGTSAKRGGR